MGCQISIEETNRKVREAIDKLDYSSLNFYLNTYNSFFLDPSLIHFSAMSSQIDIISLFIEKSNIN